MTAPATLVRPPGFQAAPSLVPPKSITHEIFEAYQCDSSSWVRADCADHGTTRWVQVPCKRRFCPYCGYVRRAKLAARIDQGIITLAGPRGAGYVNANWGQNPPKPEAVRKVTRLVAWLRRHQAVRPEYAITWEQTRKHVLHVNIIFAPWRYVDQQELSDAWFRLTGWRVVWVARVGRDIAAEAAKANHTPGWYFAKREQMVVTGRSCAFSKGWPKLPDAEKLPRKGKLLWTPPWALQEDPTAIPQFEQEQRLGWWLETAPGWWKNVLQSQCDCYSLVHPVQT